jgi:hypothetical protein
MASRPNSGRMQAAGGHRILVFGEAPRHPQSSFAPLVVALHDPQLIETQARVEIPRRFVVSAQFEIDAKHTRFDGSSGEPLHELRAKPLAPMFRCHREQVEVCDFVAKVHDRECGNPPFSSRHHDRRFGAANKMLNARRRPRPGQSLFDQIARHFRNLACVACASQTNEGEF